MKKAIILLTLAVVLLSAMTMANGLRLGISAVDNYGGGARIVDVFYGYPAYGQLCPGDVITHVGYYRGSGPVIMCSNYCTFGNITIHVNNPQGTWVSGSGHLQSLIFGAPYSGLVTLWVNRNGYRFMLVIQLRNLGGGGTQPIVCSVGQ